MKIAGVLLLASCLGGCGAAPPWTPTERAVNEKAYAVIEHRLDIALQSGQEPGQVWADYGDLYMKQAQIHPENAMFFKRKATSAFMISAQYGNSGARDVLRRNDIPVPDAIFKN